jgi:hypothetical protein
VFAALNSQVAALREGPREQGGLRMIFPWGPEVDELACRVGGSGDGKEPVEVMRECVNKVRVHYGVGQGEKRGASASAAGRKQRAGSVGAPGVGGVGGASLSRAALLDYYQNGD